MSLRRTVRIGLIGGAIVIFLAMVGMVQAFNARNIITDVVGMGFLLVILVMFMAGLIASRDAVSPGGRVMHGAVAGLITGAATGVALLIRLFFVSVLEIEVRGLFLSVTPQLIEILTFGRDEWAGLALLAMTGVLAGGAGGAIRLLPDVWRKVVTWSLVSTLLVSLMEPLVAEALDNLGLPDRWLYEDHGLTIRSTLIVFAAAFVLSVAQMLVRRRPKAEPIAIEGKVEIAKVSAIPRSKLVLFGVLLVVLLIVPYIGGSFVSTVLGNVGLYVLLGLGLNIVVGYAGLLDLGYVAFFAVGAYAMGVLTARSSFLVTDEIETAEGGRPLAEAGLTNFWFALPIVVAIAVLIGVAIGAPVLRLRGDYLAIVTLGFGEIIRTLVLSDWLKPYLGGAQGLTEAPAPPPGSLEFNEPERIYYLILAFCLFAVFVAWRLADSRVGRAWIAMREDEDVAEAMGISVVRYKLLAFAMGAAIGCLGGAFFAAKIGSIFANSFELIVSINVLAVIILGGMGSIPGVVVGALVLVGLPDVLREFGEYRILLYGAILVAIMVYRPQGLLPNKRRTRELHQAEPEETTGALPDPDMKGITV